MHRLSEKLWSGRCKWKKRAAAEGTHKLYTI